MDRFPSRNNVRSRGILPEDFSASESNLYEIWKHDDKSTSRILEALDSLPRDTFFGRLLRNVHVDSSEAAKRFESLASGFISPLPEGLHIASPGIHVAEIRPAALIESVDSLCVMEVRGTARGCLKPDQLAGGLVLAHQESSGKRPALLVVCRVPPPITFTGIGMLLISEIIRLGLSEICHDPGEREYYESSIKECVGWITWDEIASCISDGLQLIESTQTSIEEKLIRTARCALLVLNGFSPNG